MYRLSRVQLFWLKVQRFSVNESLFEIRDLSRLCPPPPPVRYAPPVTEHVSLHSKSLSKNIARESGVANNMHPLSWGAQTEKDTKLESSLLWALS